MKLENKLMIYGIISYFISWGFFAIGFDRIEYIGMIFYSVGILFLTAIFTMKLIKKEEQK